MLLTEADRKVWDRIVSRTMEDCRALVLGATDTAATAAFQTLAEEQLDVPKDTAMAEYQTAVRTALDELMERSVDSTSHSKDRRKAYTAMQEFLKTVRTIRVPIRMAAASADDVDDDNCADSERQQTKKRPREEATAASANGNETYVQLAQRKAAKAAPDLEGMVPLQYLFAQKYGITDSIPHLLVSSESPSSNHPSTQSRRMFCTLCNVWVPSTGMGVVTHCKGRPHQSQLMHSTAMSAVRTLAPQYGFASSLPFLVESSQPDRVFCTLCRRDLTGHGQAIASHCNEANHRSFLSKAISVSRQKAIPAARQKAPPPPMPTTTTPLQNQVTAGTAAAAHASLQEQRSASTANAQQTRSHRDQITARSSAVTEAAQTNKHRRKDAAAAGISTSPVIPSRTPPSDRWPRATAGHPVQQHPSDKVRTPLASAPAAATGALKTTHQQSSSSASTVMIPLAFARAPTPTTITAQADPKRPTLSCTVEPRPMPVKVTFTQIVKAPRLEVDSIRERLSKWEPFIHVVHEVGLGVTSPVIGTTPSFPAIQTAAVWFFPLQKAYSIMQQDKSCQLVLRMIPRKEKPSKKRADGHLWPLGTLLQIDSKPIELQQRRQQLHNANEWKRTCHPINITSAALAARQQKLEVALTTYDASTYACHVSVCQKLSPKALYSHIVRERSIITFLEPLASIAKAKAVAAKSESLCVVDDDDDDNQATNATEQGKFVFSLLCPLTKKPIVSPVRGKHCKHWQCFDLESFLNVNNVVSGTRWRCGACEEFVSLSMLEHCSLTAKILKTFAATSKDRDRVEFRADGSFELLSERKKRYKSKEQPPSSVSGLSDSFASGKEHEIIDLD